MNGNNERNEIKPDISRKRLLAIGGLSWLIMIGFDFFLHAGLLAGLYTKSSPFLLPPLDAFRMIPIGYLSFLVMNILLVWLMVRLQITCWRRGFIFGLTLGSFTWGSFVLGLWSISTAKIPLLIGWFAGQTFELGLGGAVVGSGLAGEKSRKLAVKVVGIVVLLIVITILLQSLGLAPSTRIN